MLKRLVLLLVLLCYMVLRQNQALADSPRRIFLPIVVKQEEPCPPENGRWEGETVTSSAPDQPSTISFVMSGNGTKISSGAQIGFYFRITSGFWTCSGGRITLGWSVPVGSDCQFDTSGGLIHKAVWNGTFTGKHQAEGAFRVDILTTMCGRAVRSGTWRATWLSP